MRPDIKAALVKIVRDGLVPIGSKVLFDPVNKTFCPNGILCQMFKITTGEGYWEQSHNDSGSVFCCFEHNSAVWLPYLVKVWSNTSQSEVYALARSVDVLGLRGAALADYIEREIPETA